MAQVQFNLKAVLEASFASRAAFGLLKPKKEEPSQPDFTYRIDIEGAESQLQTDFGVLVQEQMLLIFENGSEYLMSDPILIDIQQQKQIVETAITGRAGTIKEYISPGDAVVYVRGWIWSVGDAHPLEAIKALQDVYDYNRELSVVSPTINAAKIEKLVMVSMDFPVLEGSWDQPFVLRCVQDRTEELIIEVEEERRMLPI